MTEALYAGSEVPRKKPRGKRQAPTRRQAQSERSRSDIIDAAMSIIAQYGFREATIDLIAEAAGISATSIYWHFGNRAGMLQALAMRITDRYTQEVLHELGRPLPTDPEQWVRGYVRGITRLAMRNPEIIRTQTALSAEGVMLPEIREGVKQYNRDARRPTVQMVDRGVREGLFRPLRGNFWVDFVIGSTLGASMQARFHLETVDTGPLFTAVGDASLMLLGLDPNGAEAPRRG